MKQTTKLYLVIVGLIAVIFWRECIHAQRTAKIGQYYNDLIACEQALDTYGDAYQDGFNACLEQF